MRALGGLALLVSLPLAAASARADDEGGARPATKRETEKTLVPVVGGDTDVGFGFGGVGSITRVEPGFTPYRWNLEASGLMTFKYQDGVQVPYQDLQIKLTIPEIFPRVRLVLNPGYNHEHAFYYGLGNASTDTAPAWATTGAAQNNYFQFSRTHPQIAGELRYEIEPQLFVLGGLEYTQSWLGVHAPSKLVDDLQSGSPTVRRILGNAGQDNGVALVSYGFQWDSRDNETAPTRGNFDQVRLRISPGGFGDMPYRYANVEFNARFYAQLGTPKLVFAARWTTDLLVGNPPFYELARFEETNAIGGPFGVRGVPAQRYYGKIKTFGGVELRGDVARVHALGKDLQLGLVGFFDAGRVWADYAPHPDLDGTGLGLKYGIGTGARVRSGTAFVLRADVAWSPDARPIGGYLGAGQAF